MPTRALLTEAESRFSGIFGAPEAEPTRRRWRIICGHEDRGELTLAPGFHARELRASLTITNARGRNVAGVDVAIASRDHLDYLVEVVKAACRAMP